MYPELGTWGSPANCTAENDPTNSNLLNWITNDPHVLSDNNYISFFAVGGLLFGSGETYYIWLLDPVTLMGIVLVNFNKLFQQTVFKNNPETECATLGTHLAHHQYDSGTDEFF